ncbi:MAG: transporter [Planctomycetia bacterium]
MHSHAPQPRHALGGIFRGLLQALVCGFAMGAQAVAAREAEPASGLSADLGTDRDAFTPATSTVDPGTVLTEGSYVFIDNPVGLPTSNYPELLIRIGGNDWFEWRFGVNYGIGSQGNIVTSVEVGEGRLDGGTLYESSVLYGFKAAVSDQDGFVPESCFIMEASTPTYGDVFGTVPVATYVAGYELPAGWKLDAAIRYAYSEGHSTWFERGSPSVVLRVPVTSRWEVHAEYFDTFTRGNVIDVHRAFFSPGFHYMLTENLEVGLRVGWGVTAAAAPFFSDAGFGWRW